MACQNCKDTNVVTPIYTDAQPPIIKKGCNVCGTGGMILTPNSGGSGNVTIVEAGNQMNVDDNSYFGVDSFKVHYSPYIALTLSLSLIAYVGGIAQGALVLFGKIVDSVELNWSYNKAILTQAVTNTAGLLDPLLIVNDISTTYTPTVIENYKTFTLTGNDGVGQSGSMQVKNVSVNFGNYIMSGSYDDLINQSESTVNALIASLLTQSFIISNSKSRSVFSTGGANKHFFYVLPKRLGEVTFSKNNFVGGFFRLKIVNGVIKSILSGGDVETDIVVVNSEGYSETYYIYQSSVDNQEDAIVPFIIL